MIAGSWELLVIKRIKAKFKGVYCLRKIVLMSSLYKDNYEDVQNVLNYYIINCILFKKSRQLARHYTFLMN